VLWSSVVAALFTTVIAAGPGMAAESGRTVPIDVVALWTGSRECVAPREGSVICIRGEGTVAGLGKFEYARDAVPTGGTTADGCPMYSTHGEIYIDGGTAVLDGTPAAVCGTDHVPDANYVFTISGGTGSLAGATGSGTILADRPGDNWHGTIVFAASPSAVSAPAKRSQSKRGGIVAGIVVLLAAACTTIAVLVRRRGRSVPVETI
jgi:hypothetical protein